MHDFYEILKSWFKKKKKKQKDDDGGPPFFFFLKMNESWPNSLVRRLMHDSLKTLIFEEKMMI